MDDNNRMRIRIVQVPGLCTIDSFIAEESGLGKAQVITHVRLWRDRVTDSPPRLSDYWDIICTSTYALSSSAHATLSLSAAGMAS